MINEHDLTKQLVVDGEINNKPLDIEEAITRLIYKKSFYARVASGITRREVTDVVCKTMAVVVSEESEVGIELIYNPNYFKTLKHLEEFEFLIEHEMVHLILKHVQRFWDTHMEYTDLLHHKLFNIAADMADNSNIVEHYKDVKHYTDRYFFPSKWNTKWPNKLSMEEYTKLLYADPKIKEAIDMSQLVSEHLWGNKIDKSGNLIEANKKDLKRANTRQELHFKDYIDDCVKKHEKSAGNLPGYVREQLQTWIKPEVHPDWMEILQGELMTGMPNIRMKSLFRPTRRLWGIKEAIKFPGKKTARGYKIGFISDTSGSMSEKTLAKCYGLLWSLCECYEQVELWAAMADTQIHNIKKINGPEDFDLKMLGRGGTDFILPLETIIKEINPDIIVYSTDGYGSAPDKQPKNVAVIWLITDRGKPPAKWGKVVKVEEGGYFGYNETNYGQDIDN